jgi:hypothetical protein
MNLGTLNTIIAVVVVLLVLSLIVQSIQTGIKKLLSLKSEQIVESIKDLYDQAISTQPRPVQTQPTNLLGKLWSLITGTKRTFSPDAHGFSTAVLDQSKNIGRVDRFGKVVLDSLAKEDLVKVIAKLELKPLFGGEFGKFESLVSDVRGLGSSIEILAKNQELVASLSTQISKVRAVFAPLLEGVEALLDDENQLNAKVVFGDMLQLTTLNTNAVLDLIKETETVVQEEIERKTAASPAESRTPEDQAALNGLNIVAGELPKISKAIGDVSQKFNEAVAPLRAKLNQIETWFDTVTQSFDERYTRHMKTVSICISAVVVILLNANFFQMYRTISTNEVQRNLIADAGAKILEASRKAEEATTPTEPPAKVDVKKEFDKTKAEIDAYVSNYQQFGFAPLSTAQLNSFVWSTGGWSWLYEGQPDEVKTATATGKQTRFFSGWTINRNDKGIPLNKSGEPIYADCSHDVADCIPVWRPQTTGEWWAARKQDVTVLFGWIVMVLLLSVGAPFWQDTLESLFGIKNLLRQKSGTQNVEEKSGAGQPKQA